MDGKDYKKFMVIILTIIVFVLAFFIIKSILIALLFGFLLAYLFESLYLRLKKKLKSENLSAAIIVFGILAILIIPLLILIPLITRQVINAYFSIQDFNLISALSHIFPSIAATLSTSADFSAIANSFTSSIAGFILNGFKGVLLNLSSIILQIVVVLFTFFFALRDYKKLEDYITSISPFSKDSQNVFYEKFRVVTNSVLYGQIIVGFFQGLVAGIGYFIFGVPNAFLLTFLTMITATLPIIGAWIVWIPVVCYLFSIGSVNAAFGMLIYGIVIVSWIDNLVRFIIISKYAKMNTAIALIGMIGGLFVFGILGLIIGPLVLAYSLLIIELFKENKVKSIIIDSPKS